MSDTAMCDWVWDDLKDGYNYWICQQHGCVERAEAEEDEHGSE